MFIYNGLIIFILSRGRAGQEVMPTTLENIIQDFVLNFSGLAQATQLPVYVQQ